MKCNICGEDKEETEFYKNQKRCKKCSIAKIKEWKSKNPEKVKASQKKRRLENGDEIRKKEASWRENNREKVREISKRYRENNREICRERGKNHYHDNKSKYRFYAFENKERCKEYAKNYRKRNREQIRERHKNHAKRYRKEKPKEHKARKDVYYAIKKGELVRPNQCKMCGKVCKPEAHHYDYDKPLDVIWVCKTCHSGIHSMVLK